MRLKDKVAIVTGGGRGIGAATARRFLAEGALVEVWEVSAAAADQAAADLAAADLTHGGGPREAGRLHVEVVDVVDQGRVSGAVSEVIARRGKVDILINNAGIIADDFAADLNLEDWDRVLRVNLTGTFICAQAVIPHFREQRSGAIVNTSSTSALGNKGQANYAASKAGVIGLTRTLALELARDGIRVNCIAPGTIDTEMFRGVPEKVREKFLARIPLGRLGRPEEVASLHLFLASDESSYMTGQTIFCDGGISL
jgi:NAD(P)-dependent dehydrogenase (short-subunit alcohol dehydrogenase family)